MMYAAHTFGGPLPEEEMKELTLTFFNKYQQHHFSLSMTKPIKVSDGLKEYAALTSLCLEVEGKTTIEYGVKSLSNVVAAALRAHEAKTGPNPEFIEGLAAYHDALLPQVKAPLEKAIRKVNQEFDIAKVFDRFSGAKRVNHRVNTFEQFRRPEAV